MATLQIRKKAVKTWWHVPSDQKQYAVSKLYCKFNGENFRIVEQGGRQRAEYHYSDITVFDDTQGGSAETFASPLALFLRLEALEYVGFEWGSGGGGVGFQPQIIAPQDGQVIIYDDGVWHNGFLDLQGNRFIQTQDIPPIEDNILTVPFGFVWIINTITYSNLTNWIDTIPFTSSEEMVRTDIIVAIASNTFVRIQGEENDGFPIQPTLPPNSLLVTSIDVYHDSFGTPTEPITGNQFIKKSSEAFVQVVPTAAEFKLNIDNHRNFVVNSALEQTTIVGVMKTATNGSTSTDTNWSGSDLHIYRKIGSGPLKVKHHSIPDFNVFGYTLYFPDGEDYDMEEGEMLTFRLMQHGTLITNSSIMAFPIYIFAGSSKGGGSFVFTEDIPVVLSGTKTLGRYGNGQTIPAIGKNPQEVLQDIALEYLTPSFTSFGITQTTPIEVGTVISGNKNFTFAFQYPENIEDDSISIIDVTDSNTVIGSGLSKTSPVSVNVGSISKTAVASHQWRATAVNTQSNTVQSALATVNWQFRYFRGAVSTIPVSGSALRTAMLSDSVISNANTFSFTTGTTLKDFVIAIPSHKTLVEAKNMGTNENLSFVLSGTITTVPDAGSTERSYKVYTLSNAVPFSSNYNINVTLS